MKNFITKNSIARIHDKSKKLQHKPFEMLYVKPKSFLRASIQKLFLKLLLKLFPKKFESYKTRIRFIMNRGKFLLYLYWMNIYLRFRYPFHFRLPATQIYSLHVANKILEILKPIKNDIFLVGGCLLGAIRQGSFAGRPADIDFGIREKGVPTLLNAIPLFIKNGAMVVRKHSHSKMERLQILFPSTLVDIGVYRIKKLGKKEVWMAKTEGFGRQSFKMKGFGNKKFIKYNKWSLPLSLDTLVPINVYGKQFLAPSNSEIYLEKKYGKNWKIPDKKQFFFRRNKFN